MNELKVGDQLWIPCEVKPGPLSSERLARIQPTLGEWVGFIDEVNLKNPVPTGETWVRALVTDIVDNEVILFIRGETLRNSQIQVSQEVVKEAAHHVSVEA